MIRFTYSGADGCPLAAYATADKVSNGLPVVVLLHGGGPDHRSLIPLAR
jgi:predicted esterase